MEASRGRTWWMSALWSFVLCGLLAAPGEPGVHYVVHDDPVSFDAALIQCSSSQEGGSLTTLATQREVEEVLAAVSPSLPGRDGPSDFWLGLRKAKTDCVVPHLPLKGFKWTKGGGEETQVPSYPWKKEPPETCTGLLCLMLSVESEKDWGLSDSSCRKKHPFICKYTDADMDGQAKTPVETDSVTLSPVTPFPDARTTTTLTPTSTPAPTSSSPEPTQPPQAPPTQPPPPPPPPPSSSSSSSSRPQPHPEVEKGDCSTPFVNSSRFFRQHPDNPSRLTVECWSGVEVELNCSASSGRWEVDGVRLDQLDVCGRCEDGYEKDASWTCRDVDECPSAPCRAGLGCVNTPGGYRCVCYDAQGGPHDPGSADCVPSPTDAPAGGGGGAVESAGSQSGILIPVLIAVLVLAVLLVVAAVVVVKCCLMRRSKKRALEKDDKVAMDATRNKDTMETANEKEAI